MRSLSPITLFACLLCACSSGSSPLEDADAGLAGDEEATLAGEVTGGAKSFEALAAELGEDPVQLSLGEVRREIVDADHMATEEREPLWTEDERRDSGGAA